MAERAIPKPLSSIVCLKTAGFLAVVFARSVLLIDISTPQPLGSLLYASLKRFGTLAFDLLRRSLFSTAQRFRSLPS